MSTTPAAQLARVKCTWPNWTIIRCGDLLTATHTGGRTVRATYLAELETRISRAEWHIKRETEGES